MKKVFSLVLAMILLLSVFPFTALAEPKEEEPLDFSKAKDDELIEMYNAIRNELATRGFKAEDKKVILEDKDIQVYINGDWEVEKDWSGLVLKLPVIIVNNRNQSIGMRMVESSVNGWTCETSFWAEIPAGKKLKETLVFELEDTDVTSLKDFEDAEFKLDIFDNNTWDDILTSDAIVLVAG